jgi:hypothetical protein
MARDNSHPALDGISRRPVRVHSDKDINNLQMALDSTDSRRDVRVSSSETV